MRDRLTHHYFGIDYEMVRGVETSKMKDLIEPCAPVLKRSTSLENAPCDLTL
jgi:uncharacterized protein with HEPN domain